MTTSSADRAISAIILTFNSALSIERTLTSVRQVAADIHIVDSFSTDDTLAICQRYGCEVVQRPFLHYADQRNWAIDNLKLAYSWQLHVDADEELSADLIEAIRTLDLAHTKIDGWIFGRKLVFMGRTLRFGAIAKTWHYRLFRTGNGRCEDRLYDQCFVAKGNTGRIRAFILNHHDMSLSDWTLRHNRWSDLETAEISKHIASQPSSNIVKAQFTGNLIERKRFYKRTYYSMPLFARAIAYFLYRYFIRLGFLDGVEGLIYHTLQGFWFRFLIDAKIFERKARSR